MALMWTPTGKTNRRHFFATQTAASFERPCAHRELGWTPITINAVIPINVDNGFNHADIQLMIRTTNNAILDGSGKSTFYIKYLGA